MARVEESKELGEKVAGQDGGENGLFGEDPDFRIAVKRESLVGRGDLTLDTGGLPLKDIWLQGLFALYIFEEDPCGEGGSWVGLGDKTCVVI